MSKYTDFYGVTSVGDYPINSYFEYGVTATGNPTGYDASTGLYSHPNGSTWLQTGNTLPTSSAYPNATTTTTGGATGFIDTVATLGAGWRGICYDSVNNTFWIANGTTTITEWAADFSAATGRTGSLPPVPARVPRLATGIARAAPAR